MKIKLDKCSVAASFTTHGDAAPLGAADGRVEVRPGDVPASVDRGDEGPTSSVAGRHTSGALAWLERRNTIELEVMNNSHVMMFFSN